MALDISRRRMLVGAAVVTGGAGAGYLVARNSTHDSSSSGYGESRPPPAANADAEPGAALVAIGEVPDGGGVVLAQQRLVVTRSGESIHGFSAVCTHSGCLVDAVRDGAISCPCHGSRFNAQTGEVIDGPAARPLPVVSVTVTDGEVRRG